MQQSIYDPGFKAFGGGTTGTLLAPVVLVALLLVTLLIFFLPRKYVSVVLVFGLLMIPFAQNIYVFGVHLFVARILIVFGLLRAAFTKLTSEHQPMLAGGINTVDKLFVVWAVYRAVAVVLLFGQLGAAPGQIGFLWDALGGYFLFRCLVHNDADVSRVIKALAVIAIVVAVGMVREQMTLHNIFASLGGINPAPAVRNGRIRAQGVFAISILAGSFGATSFPLFLWLWKYGRAYLLSAFGALAAVVITYASSSSTPILALVGGIFALFFWPMRRNMRVILGLSIAGMILLSIVMRAPIWFLLAHIDAVGGSSGWERGNLINNFVMHFGDWWLIGTHDNVNWGWDMWDLANQFVAEGVTGGLVTFASFIGMIWICFKRIGQARRAVEGDPQKEWLFWIFGAVLFDQTLAFFGIDYFDQMRFMWYLMLAMILATTAGVPAKVEDKAATAPTAVVSGGVPLFKPTSPEPQFTARTLARR